MSDDAPLSAGLLLPVNHAMSNPVSLGKTGATSRILASGANRAAFTLIELSLVLLLVGILMTIAIGLTQSVTERGRRSRAETELAVIAAALEQFRTQYGDYPQTGVPAAFAPLAEADGGDALTTASVEARLVNALFGVLGPKLTVLQRDGVPVLGPSFLEAARFTFEKVDATTGRPELPETAGDEVANALLDPWGRRYQYAYRPVTHTGSWYPSFVLFSAGPDGEVGVSVDAQGRPTVDAGADDILAGR